MTIRITPRAVVLTALVIAVLYGYPGYLTQGADDQLVDSRVGSFTDWAPPLMTELWRVIGWLWSGPAPLFFTQIVLLVVGAYHLLEGRYRARAAAGWAAAVLVMPPVLATISVICPESQLVAFGIAAAAALGARSWVRWLALPMIAYASSLGSGAAAAMLPIVLLRFNLLRVPRRWMRYGVALAIWGVLVLAGAWLGSALVQQPSHRAETALAMDDVIGVLHQSGPISDAEAHAALTGTPLAVTTDIQRTARALDGHFDRYAAGPARLFDEPTTEAQKTALQRSRRTLLLAHPVAYLQHRLRRALRVLGVHRGHAWVAVYSQFVGSSADRDALDHYVRHSPVQRVLLWAVAAVSHTPLFHPYLYAILALILLPVALVWRARDAAMLLASGLCGEVAMLVSIDGPELRYSLWLIVTTFVAIALLVATRVAASEPRDERVGEQT